MSQPLLPRLTDHWEGGSSGEKMLKPEIVVDDDKKTVSSSHDRAATPMKSKLKDMCLFFFFSPLISNSVCESTSRELTDRRRAL